MSVDFKSIIEEIRALKTLGGLRGQQRVMWKQDGVCYGTSWTMSFGAITEDDIYEMEDYKPEVQAFMKIKGFDYMVMAQPKYAAYFARKNQGIDVILDDMAQIIGGRIEAVDSDDFEKIVSAFKKAPAVLLSDIESALTLGRDPYEAFSAMTVLEKTAEASFGAGAIGGAKTLSGMQIAFHRNKYLKKYSEIRIVHKDALTKGDFDERELALRQALADAGKTLLADGLIQGTWGNLSVRLDEGFMLVTPSGLPYDILTPDDMVKVRLVDLEHAPSENEPTSEAMLHSAIYLEREDVAAIVHTHSAGASAFAAARMPLEIPKAGARPEELIRCTDYERPGTNKIANKAVKELRDKSGVILANHGMVSVGETLGRAIENAHRMEQAAKKAIDARSNILDVEVYIR